MTQALVDPDRPAHLLSPQQGRKLFVKLWYPGQLAPAATPEMLWDELRDARRALLVRFLVKLIQRPTASYPGAPLTAGQTAAYAVIYNHGLISSASENTSLMQELASRGAVVVAIEHYDQLAEFQALNQQQSLPDKRLGRDLAARIRRANATERAGLARQLYAASPNTKRIVVERARDTQFVLDRLPSLLATIPGGSARVANVSSVHLVGYSLGGAVATHLAGVDKRVASVVNIDGGIYGSPDAGALSVPYLMMYSARNDAINDELLPKNATRVSAASTHHLNYHDIAGLLPPLRWIRATGSADPIEVLQWRNDQIARFLDMVSQYNRVPNPR
jgi:dienelactone hydrolase